MTRDGPGSGSGDAGRLLETDVLPARDRPGGVLSSEISTVTSVT